MFPSHSRIISCFFGEEVSFLFQNNLIFFWRRSPSHTKTMSCFWSVQEEDQVEIVAAVVVDILHAWRKECVSAIAKSCSRLQSSVHYPRFTITSWRWYNEWTYDVKNNKNNNNMYKKGANNFEILPSMLSVSYERGGGLQRTKQSTHFPGRECVQWVCCS